MTNESVENEIYCPVWLFKNLNCIYDLRVYTHINMYLEEFKGC